MRPRALTLILALAIGSAGAAERGALACPAHLAFLKSRCSEWLADVLPERPPPARGNAVADSQPAAALGMRIFYDNRFSRPGSGVACANCHDPEHAFAEKKPRSETIRQVARNAPDLINAAWYARAHFWDGKVDNLWSAPLFTFEQPDEMGSSRLHVVHTLASIYKIRYEKIFGPLPDLSDTQRFPQSGGPGTPAFERMSKQDKELVNRVYANVGKALEAYVRKLAAGRSQFDDFINGSAKSLSVDAQRGMVAFTRHGCDTCHSGPTFSDEEFHDLRYRQPGQPQDPGRAGGIALASQWPFTSTGPFADRTPGESAAKPLEARTGDRTGFRTPTLRNVELTYPYGHDGSFPTLEGVIDAHSHVLPHHAAPGARDMHDIIEFLHSLTGRPPQPPWNYWPGG